MSIDRDTLKRLRVDIDALLAALAPKYGLRSLKTGNCTFTDGSFTFKLEGIAADGLSAEERNYNLMREAWPVLPALGSVVKYGGHDVTVTGANKTGTKVHYSHGGKQWQSAFMSFLAAVNRQRGAESRDATVPKGGNK